MAKVIAYKSKKEELVERHKKEAQLKLDFDAQFDLLLNNGSGSQLFMQFLKGNYAAHYFLFWQAIDTYKKIDRQEIGRIRSKCEDIFETFLTEGGAQEIAMDEGMKSHIHAGLDKEVPAIDIFEEAQLECANTLKYNFYRTFLKTELCIQWKNEEERKLKRKRRQERKAILKKNFKQSKYRKQAALLDDDEYLQTLALHKAEEANKAKIKKGKHQKQKKGVGKAKAKK